MVGGAKLAEGLYRLRGPKLTAIVNTGDDYEYLGLPVSPDVDTMLYALAGIADANKGWEPVGESYACHGMLTRLGGPAEPPLGDRALALQLLRALLDGGLVPGARLPEWRGRLESLSATGLTDFALAAPATLVLSAGRCELGEARFAGEPGEIRLAVTRWTPAGLETRGSSNAVVVRTLRRMLKLQGEMGSNLVLAGEWDVRAGESVDGFVSIRRERGDVRVGDPRQALGLEVLALRVEAGGGRLRASADMRGKQVGQWKGEASATLARAGAGWEISPTAPIEGRRRWRPGRCLWCCRWRATTGLPFGPRSRRRVAPTRW